MIEELKNLKEGSVVRIKGYRDSSGAVRDIEATLLGKDGYQRLTRQALVELSDIDFVKGASVEEIEAARTKFKKTLETESKPMQTKHEPAPWASVWNVQQVPGEADVYLVNLADTSAMHAVDPKLEKRTMRGAYIPKLKLSEGKYESIEVAFRG